MYGRYRFLQPNALALTRGAAYRCTIYYVTGAATTTKRPAARTPQGASQAKYGADSKTDRRNQIEISGARRIHQRRPFISWPIGINVIQLATQSIEQPNSSSNI